MRFIAQIFIHELDELHELHELDELHGLKPIAQTIIR
jgi:hypothetical protein